MTQFDDNGDRIIAFVSEGLPLTESCSRIGISYQTVRKWVTAGRRDPRGRYGQFVVALDAARGTAREDEDEREPGPVETEVERLITGRNLNGDGAIAAVQARALARAVDSLAARPGGAAAMGLAAVSRRLEDLISSLRLQPKDRVTELQERHRERRAKQRAEYERNGATR